MSNLVTENKKRKEVEGILIRLFLDIGMDIPDNMDKVVEFCTEDVHSCSDSRQWHDGDVTIAFRKFIERSCIE